MKKNHRGFSLIELLIAISVLSIMGGVLLRFFVISHRFNAKARTEEIILDAAERTMEAVKGTSLTQLDTMMQSDTVTSGALSTGKEITLGNMTYQCVAVTETDESGSTTTCYRLTSAPQHLGGTSGSGSYITETDIAWSPYGDPSSSAASEDSKANLNQYRSPKITDVSSAQNIVLDYDTLLQTEEQWVIYFDSHYNQQEETNTNENGGGTESGNSSDPEYDIANTVRYLELIVSEKQNGDTAVTLTVSPVMHYRLQTGEQQTEEQIFSIRTYQRTFDPSKPGEVPVIYLYLPDRDVIVSAGTSNAQNAAENDESGNTTQQYPVKIDSVRIRMNTGNTLQNRYEMYAVPENNSTNITINEEKVTGNKTILASEGTASGIRIHTFDEGVVDVASADARKRLYAITVRVFPAERDASSSSGWKTGESVLELHSAVRE